ncbi:hypothetical protein EDB89DRAFT_2001016 [Lactarius sanguifluus]|nr:hypothetical protein EDB89DRAFT_2001016 [Lactarius sanguifluus]
MDPIQSIVGIDEELPVTRRSDVYPVIDPNEAFANQTYRGKVVFITGASRGIGQETAITYTKAGASVTVVGRSQESLDRIAAAIRTAVSEAHAVAYLKRSQGLGSGSTGPARAVRSARCPHRQRGRFVQRQPKYVVVGIEARVCLGDTTLNAELGDKDPERWWNTFEVNIQGVYNTIRASLSALEKTSGCIVIVSSSLAQLRFLLASDYAISKHALNRLVEFIALGA